MNLMGWSVDCLCRSLADISYNSRIEGQEIEWFTIHDKLPCARLVAQTYRYGKYVQYHNN
uniref:Uncharacterized protein n=1 Tax=Rhizophora mucronata TaxID=61149 RepID=A0A2P2L2W0_RHIMU